MEKNEILNYLMEHPEYAEVLKLAVQHELENADKQHYLGWEWSDVRAYPATIRKLIVDGLVRVSYNSRSFTNYKLVNLEATKQALEEFEKLALQPPEEEKIEIPEDLFSTILGSPCSRPRRRRSRFLKTFSQRYSDTTTLRR